MVRENLNNSNVSRDRFAILFITVVACLFTAVIIAQSLRQGRLSLPATYDDVEYFNDAAHRLQILYDNGILSCLVSLFRNPPHSPFATLVPFLGFSVFGIKDWAPAAVNLAWVALLLYFVKILMSDVPRGAYVTVAVSTLCWPLTATMVVECRPDIYTALLTVMGATLMFRAPFLQAARHHTAVVAVLFGAALLAKPSVSPVTLFLYCACLSIVVIIEGRGAFDRQLLRKAALRVSQYLAITAAVALLYFAVAWQDIYGYIYTVMLGSQKEIWGTKLSAFDTAGYYLWGPGGQTMMGVWFWITIFLVSVDVILGLLTRRPLNSRAIGLIIVFVLAYGLVTLPSIKTPFLGVIVSIFFMVCYVLACCGIIESLARVKNYGRWIAVGFGAALLTTSAAAFHWAWPILGTSSHLTAGRRNGIIQQLGDYIESHVADYTNQMLFFPAITQFVNSGTLLFELQKRRVENVNTVSHIFSFAGQRAALGGADYVILFDESDPDILPLPDKAYYSQVKALVVSDPSFAKKLDLPTADLQYKISVYARKNSSNQSPFLGLSPISGFLPIEGPYPQWNLSLVRWATGYSARAKISANTLGEGHLLMRVRSDIAGQSIDVKVDEEHAGTCDLSTPGVFVACSFSVNLNRPEAVLDLLFGKSGSAKDGGRSVLFTELRLDF
jgi:hypothetical protein